MADMVANQASKSAAKTLLTGERISIRILNSDGTEKEVVFDEAVPAGKTFTGTLQFGGTIS